MRLSAFILLFVVNFLEAQEWAPIGAEWQYEQVEFGMQESNYHRLISVGDTIILGKESKIVRHEFVEEDTIRQQAFQYTCEQEGRVYFYNEHDNEYELVYDFSAEQGDTLEIGVDTSNGFWVSQGNTVTTVVDSVYEETHDGNKYEVQEYVSVEPGPWNTNAKVYKWIGEYWWLLPTVSGADPVTGGGLNCYRSDSLNLSLNQCDYLSSSWRISQKELKVHPNPSQGIINIEYEDEIDEVFVIDMSGNRIQVIERTGIRIEMPGVYILEIHTQGGVLSRRIVNLP